jgi:hypothetical protein
MNANQLMRARLLRAALASVAIPGALALMGCGVAVLAFELKNVWTLSASLVVAAICGLVAVSQHSHLPAHRQSLKIPQRVCVSCAHYSPRCQPPPAPSGTAPDWLCPPILCGCTTCVT